MRKVREREFEPFPEFFPPLAKDLCEKLLVLMLSPLFHFPIELLSDSPVLYIMLGQRSG
jgi:hypothetical protein